MPTPVDHHHCKVCGNAIAPEDDFCSQRCREKREATLQRGRNLQMLMYAAIAIFALLLVSELVH